MLDEISNMAQEHHFVRNGLILIGIALTIILTLKSAAGIWWWRHEKKPPKNSRKATDRYNRQKYGID